MKPMLNCYPPGYAFWWGPESLAAFDKFFKQYVKEENPTDYNPPKR